MIDDQDSSLRASTTKAVQQSDSEMTTAQATANLSGIKWQYPQDGPMTPLVAESVLALAKDPTSPEHRVAFERSWNFYFNTAAAHDLRGTPHLFHSLNAQQQEEKNRIELTPLIRQYVSNSR